MKDSGSYSEAVFASEAVKRGWYVYTTSVGHSEPADAIIFRPPERPILIQIKTATRRVDRKNAYCIYTGRGRGSKEAYKKGDFDVLAAWIPDQEKFIFWSFADIRGRVKITYYGSSTRQPGNWEVLDDVTFGDPEV